MPPPISPNRHTIDRGATRPARPPRCDDADLMPAVNESPQDLEEMTLSTARLRVAWIQPIDHEKLHNRPARRASVSSTPFTKGAALESTNQCARRTASLIATRGGTSALDSS